MSNPACRQCQSNSTPNQPLEREEAMISMSDTIVKTSADYLFLDTPSMWEVKPEDLAFKALILEEDCQDLDRMYGRLQQDADGIRILVRVCEDAQVTKYLVPGAIVPGLLRAMEAACSAMIGQQRFTQPLKAYALPRFSLDLSYQELLLRQFPAEEGEVIFSALEILTAFWRTHHGSLQGAPVSILVSMGQRTFEVYPEIVPYVLGITGQICLTALSWGRRVRTQ